MTTRHPGDRRPDRHHVHRRVPHGGGRVLIRLRDLSRLLAASPDLLETQLGEPTLIVLGLRHDRRSVIATNRLILPARTDLPPDGLTGRWPALGRPLRSSNANAVSIIAYADRSWTSLLQSFAEAAPFTVLDLLRADQGRWWDLDCPEPATCQRPECTPFGAAIIREDVAAPNPGRIPSAAAGPQAAPRRPGSPALLKVVAEQVASTHTRRLSRLALLTAAGQARRSRAHGPMPLPPEEAAVLLRAVADPVVFDVCAAWTDEATWVLWRDLLEAAPPGWAAPVATLIALIAYQRGDLRVADAAAKDALADIPEYALAQTVRDLVRDEVPLTLVQKLSTETAADHLERPPERDVNLPTDDTDDTDEPQ